MMPTIPSITPGSGVGSARVQRGTLQLDLTHMKKHVVLPKSSQNDQQNLVANDVDVSHMNNNHNHHQRPQSLSPARKTDSQKSPSHGSPLRHRRRTPSPLSLDCPKPARQTPSLAGISKIDVSGASSRINKKDFDVHFQKSRVSPDVERSNEGKKYPGNDKADSVVGKKQLVFHLPPSGHHGSATGGSHHHHHLNHHHHRHHHEGLRDRAHKRCGFN